MLNNFMHESNLEMVNSQLDYKFKSSHDSTFQDQTQCILQDVYSQRSLLPAKNINRSNLTQTKIHQNEN